MVSGHDVGGVELQVAEMLDGLQDRGRGGPGTSVEELGSDGEATCLALGDALGGYATGTCGCFSGATARKFSTSSSASAPSYISICPESESRAISESIGMFATSGAFEAMTSFRPCEGPNTSLCEPSGMRTYDMLSPIPRLSPPSCLTN